MKKVEKIFVTDIEWDVDGDKEALDYLPKSVIVDNPEEDLLENLDANADTLCDFLSDKYGFCLYGFATDTQIRDFVVDDIKAYLQDVNLGDYDLGGVELTEEDYEAILRHVQATEEGERTLEEIVDAYLFEVRDILDAGLENMEE